MNTAFPHDDRRLIGFGRYSDRGRGARVLYQGDMRGSVGAIGAPILAETGIVIGSRLGDIGLTKLDEFLRQASTIILPFTTVHAAVTRDTFLHYGKGRHPAGLN